MKNIIWCFAMAVLISNVDAAAPNPVGPAVDQPAQEVVLTKDNWQQFAHLQNGVLTISAQVTEIGESCFYGNKQIQFVVFEPQSKLHTIRASAFRRTSLRFVELPDSLRAIEGLAFDDLHDYRCTVSFGENSQIETVGPSAFCKGTTTVIARSQETAWRITMETSLYAIGPGGKSHNPEVVCPVNIFSIPGNPTLDFEAKTYARRDEIRPHAH